MRKLSELVVTKADILKTIDDTVRSLNGSAGGDHSAYLRVREVATTALDHSSEHLMNIARRIRTRAIEEGGHRPFQDQFLRSFAKLERRYEDRMQRKADEEVAAESTAADEIIKGVIIEMIYTRSQQTMPPADAGLGGSTGSPSAPVDDKSSPEMDEYHRQMDKVLDEVGIRNGWVYSTYNPNTGGMTYVDVDDPKSAGWSFQELHFVGLIIQHEALDILRECEMAHFLKNIIGNIIVTKW